MEILPKSLVTTKIWGPTLPDYPKTIEMLTRRLATTPFSCGHYYTTGLRKRQGKVWRIFSKKKSGTWNICQMELKERSSAAVMAFTSVVTAGISAAKALTTAGILSTVRETAGVLAG